MPRLQLRLQPVKEVTNGEAPKIDIVRDIKVIEAGGFFCQACLVGKDKAAISSDPRYCQDCFDVLHEAMKTDTRWSYSASRPKVLADKGTEE